MFDSHAHLQDSRIDGILPAILKRACEDGITGVCCCGTAPSDWDSVVELHRDFNSPELIIVPAYGVHPWYVENPDEGWKEHLEALLDGDPVGAVGEIGLDGIRKEVSKERQQEILQFQLELAVVHQRPVILHGARAWGGLVEALKPYVSRIPSVVAHGFSGSAEIMKEFVDMGAYLSFAGSVCNQNAKRVRAAASQVPDGQLLIETDSPDIFPAGGSPAAMDLRNRPLNQPSNLKYICNTVASLRHVSADVIADITASNSRSALLG